MDLVIEVAFPIDGKSGECLKCQSDRQYDYLVKAKLLGIVSGK